MKHFIGVAMLVVLALVGRFWMFQRIFLGYMHGGTFRAGVSLGTIVFWLLMGVAAVWLVIAAYKFGRHRTITPQHFADELERHLLGTEGKWDWDYTTSVAIADERLERIRRGLSKFDGLARTKEQEELRAIIAALRRGEFPDLIPS
jgi:hypothetical protein